MQASDLVGHGGSSQMKVEEYVPECNVPEDHWTGMVGDVAKYIFGGFDIKGRDLIAIAGSCKTWRRYMLDNNVGAKVLGREGVLPRINEPWLTTYCLWLKSHNHFIALDISASMGGGFQGTTRLDWGVNKVEQIAEGTLPSAYRGLYFIIFSDNHATTHASSIEELRAALSEFSIAQGGTNIKSVIAEIFNWHTHQGRANPPFGNPVLNPTTSHIHIISDFETHFDENMLLGPECSPSFRAPVKFRCYQTGDAVQGQVFVKRLLEANNEPVCYDEPRAGTPIYDKKPVDYSDDEDLSDDDF